MYFITGDIHRNFERVYRFLEESGLDKNRNITLIVLGDASINYYGEKYDLELKKWIEKQGITLFCIHGNHEMRPSTIATYVEANWNGGKVYVEREFPHIIFAKDGEIYEINGKRTLVVGGGYSIDKYVRLKRNPWNPLWWEDELPSDEIKERVRKRIREAEYQVDIVLSHTAPSKYVPEEAFLKGINQSLVDHSAEDFLQEIESQLEYSKWFIGHFHIQKKIERLEFLYENIKVFDSLV